MSTNAKHVQHMVWVSIGHVSNKCLIWPTHGGVVKQLLYTSHRFLHNALDMVSKYFHIVLQYVSHMLEYMSSACVRCLNHPSHMGLTRFKHVIDVNQNIPGHVLRNV